MNKIEIYAMNIESVLEDSVGCILNNFTIGRQQEILKYQFNADRNRTAYGELLARWLLADRTGMPIKNITFTCDQLGKPYWSESEYQFNISHSGKWVVCSIGKAVNGVDVEIDQDIDMAIAKEYFLPSEYNYLLLMPAEKRNVELLKLWTIKESYLKYTGEGLSGGLASVNCLSLLQSNGPIAAINFLLPDKTVIGICSLQGFLPCEVKQVMVDNIRVLY